MSPLDARIASIGSPPFRSHLGSVFFATLSFGLFSSATTASKILWEQESAANVDSVRRARDPGPCHMEGPCAAHLRCGTCEAG